MTFHRQSFKVPPHTKKSPPQFGSMFQNTSAGQVGEVQMAATKFYKELPHRKQEAVRKVDGEEELKSSEESDYSGTSDSDTERAEGNFIADE
jgi:hypothetical protein